MLKIATYNILAQACVPGSGLATDIDLSWENRKPMLEKRLESLDADVIGLQEMDREHIEDFLAPFAEKNGYGFFYCDRSVTYTPRNHGLSFLYRKTVFSLEHQSTDEIANSKYINRIHLRLKSDPTIKFCFIVGHLQSRTDGSKAHIRTQQAEDIVNQMERFRGINRFLLLDANSDRSREGEKLFNVFEDAGYYDPICSIFTTKKCRKDSFDTSKNGIKERAIDYILCHCGNVVKPYSCIDHLNTDLLPNIYEPSDHLPQLLIVNVPLQRKRKHDEITITTPEHT